MARKSKFAQMNPVDRSIFRREGVITRMRQSMKRLRDEAEEGCAAIEKRIKEKQILLDALKRGALKP